MVLPTSLKEQQFLYLKNRYNSNVTFIMRYNPKLLIFNGKIWETLLIDHNLINKYIKVPLTKRFNIYFFESHGIPSVLFDRFFQRHFWGITNDDRMFTIPKLIHNNFESLYNHLSAI